MNRYLLTALTSAALLVPASGALAAPGDLDSSFSGDGKDLIDLGADETGAAVAIQPDGKIVLATSSASKTSGQGDFVVLRTNPDGSPDDSFSGDGQIRFSFAEPGRSSDDRAASVALGPNGKIVVAGVTNAGSFGNDMAVARLTSAGALDATFDGDGKATIGFGQEDSAAEVAVRGDGAVVVGGTALIGTDDDFAVARLTASGKPDSTWSGDGLATAHFGASEQLHGIALTADGGVAAAGKFQNVSTSTDIAVARFRADGTLDDSGFAGGGKLVTSYGVKDQASDIAVQPDGRLVLAVGVAGASTNTTLVARLTSTGARDNGFGDDGASILATGASASPDDLSVTSSGQILVSGQVAAGAHPVDFLLAKLGPDGQPDRAFGGGDGIANYDFGDFDFVLGIAVAGDRAVLTGRSGVQDVPVAAVKIDEPAPATETAPAPVPEPQPEAQPAEQPPPPPTAPPASPPPAAPVPDGVAPVLSKLKVKAIRRSEKVTFKLSEPASVRVTVQRKVKRGQRTRLVAARTIKLKGKPGANALKVKKLKPGAYRVTLKATDAAGNRSNAVRKSFVLKIARR